MATTTASATEDNRILGAAAYQSNNDGNGTTNACGYHATYHEMRFFVKFTMPSSLGTITSLKLYLKPSYTANPSQLNCHKMTATDWTESASTWIKKTSTVNWTTPGGDYDATVLDSETSFTTNTFFYFDVTGSFSWGETAAFLVKANTESGVTSEVDFYTSEHVTTGNRPYLEITYTEGGGGSTFIPKVIFIY